MRPRLLVHRLLVIALAQLCAASQAKDAASYIYPPMPIVDWVFGAKPDSVFALSDNKVVEFSFNGQRLQEVATDGTPSQMILKSGKLVVAYSSMEARRVGSSSKDKLEIYSLDDLKRGDTKISLPVTNGFRLFATAKDDHLVYVLEQGRPGFLMKVDIREGKIKSRKPFESYRSARYKVLINPNGSEFAIDSSGYLRVYEFSGDVIVPKALKGNRTGGNVPFGPNAVDPTGRGWLIRGDFYSNQLVKQSLRLDGVAAALSPTTNLAVSLKEEKSLGKEVLIFSQRSDAQYVASLPLTPKDSGRSSSSAPFLRILEFSADGRKVYCADKRRAIVVDVEKLEIDPKPLWYLRVPEVTDAVHGEELSLPLSTVGEADEVEFVIAQGPDGLKINNSNLKWKPTLKALGRHDIVVRAKSGNISDDVSFSVKAQFPALRFDFPVKQFCLDPAARFAAVHFASDNSTGELAIVDLDELKIVQRQTLKQRPIMAMDDEFVFLAPAGSATVYKLDKLTLAMKEKVSLQANLSARPGPIFGESRSSRLRAWMSGAAPYSPYGNIRRLPDGYFILNTAIYNPKGEFCCVANVGSSSTNSEPRFSSHQLRSSIGPVRLEQLRMGTLDGQTVSLVMSNQRQEAGQRVVIYDLKTNRLASFNVLPTDWSRTRNGRGGLERIVDFKIKGRRIVVAQGNFLLATKISDGDLEATPASPLRIVPPKIPIASPESNLIANVQVAGSKIADVKYAIDTPIPHITIDSKTGKLTIDTAAIWKACLLDLKNAGNSNEKRVRGISSLLPQSNVSTGPRKLNSNEIALRIPVRLIARTDDEENSLDLICPMVVPMYEYYVAARHSRASRVRQLQQRAPSAPPLTSPQTKKPVVSSASGDIAKPEVIKKLRRMEAILDNILQRLDAIEKRQGSAR